jgi:uncharacterized protein (TIGR03435 family)
VINHLWQSTIFAICIGLIALALRKNRASVRHWLWFAASVKFLIPLTILTYVGQQAERSSPPVVRVVAPAVHQITAPFPEPIELTASPRKQFNWMPWILAVWVCGTLAFGLLRLRDWRRIRSLIRTSELSTLPLPIDVRSTRGVLEPGIAGLWKPVLLLPAGIEQLLTPQQLDAVIAHELCHVRRNDNLLASIHMLVEAIFWFHPLVWWVGARLVEERERACDEAVLIQGKDPGDYAEAILNVCKRYVESPMLCVSGVTGADLKKRIEGILIHRHILNLDWTRKLLLVAAAILAAFVPFLAGIASAQSFEVASIRLVDPNTPAASGQKSKDTKGGGAGIPWEFANRRFIVSDNAFRFLVFAFGIPGCRMSVLTDEACTLLSGEPAWLRRDRYIIQATTPPGTPDYKQNDYMQGKAPELYAMLRNLFAERFHLKYHLESKEVPIYAITVARGGAKLLPSEDKLTTFPNGVRLSPHSFIFTMAPSVNGARELMLMVTDHTMQEVASALSDVMNRPVVDRTGIQGRFSLQLQFPADPDNPAPGLELRGPGLFTAFQEQAGLRIEAAKQKMDMLVIDSIDRPSEN